VGVLLRDGTDRGTAAADLLSRSRLDPAYRPEGDAGFLRRVDAVIGDGSE